MTSVLDSVAVPVGWESVTFGRLVERSKRAGREDLQPLSVFLDEGVVPRASREDNFNRLGTDMSKYLVVNPGDVVFNKLRTWQGGLGVSRYEGIVSPAYFVCRPRPGVDSRFLHYLLRSAPYLAELTRVSKFMPPSQFDILWDDLRLLPILLPDFGRQRAIADYLDTETARIDALITKKRRLIELLDERWITEVVEVTRAVVAGGMGTVALRRVIEGTVGGAWGGDPGEGEIDALCVRGTDFDTARLTVDKENAPLRGLSSTEYRSRRLLPGDLIVEKSGGGEKQPVGRVVQWTASDPAVPTNFAARLRPVHGVDGRFLTYAFRAAYETGLTRAWIKQTTGIQNLDLGGLLSEKWPIPPLGGQQMIAERLDHATNDRLRSSSLLANQIDLLVEHRQALITAAVTGEIAVPGVAA